MTTSSTDEVAALKAEANAEFAKESYLKAAALYTKAIKLDPSNAVLLSNRSAALLKLKKVTKSLEDAEECIRISPDWEKGYFRKAAVLEEMQNFEQALLVYQLAASKNQDSKDLALKIRGLQKMLQGKKAGKEGHLPTATPDRDAGNRASTETATIFQGVTTTSVTPMVTRKGALAEDLLQDLKSPEVVSFVRMYVENLIAEIRDNGLEPAAMIHLLPGLTNACYEEQDLHVRGNAAFDSPDTLGGFVEYLRACTDKLSASAALLIVPKASVAYPQTWVKPGWPAGKSEGVVLQLEAKVHGTTLKRMWFAPYNSSERSLLTPITVDPDVFSLLPNIVR